MSKQVLRFFIILSCMIILSQDSFALKCPNVYLEVAGTIVDSETKQPLQGVSLFAFLNGSSISGNAGWTPEYDYPNISPSNENGQFRIPVVTRTPYGSGPGIAGEGSCGDVKDIKITKFELIAFRKDYTTERFFVENLKFEPEDLNATLYEKYQGKILVLDPLEFDKTVTYVNP